MKQYTKHFNDKLLIVSSSFPKLVSSIKPTTQQEQNLIFLSNTILEPVLCFAKDIIITSGLRTRELNRLVGGYIDSDHIYGIAVDFVCANLLSVFEHIRINNLPYKQLIYYPEKKFIHVSVNIPGRLYQHDLLQEKNGVVVAYENRI